MHGVCNCINSRWATAAGRFLEVLHLLKSKLPLLEVLCFSCDTISQLVKVVCVVYWGSSLFHLSMFDTGHPELTWTIGPGKWTLYSWAQSKTIQLYTVIGGGHRGILRGTFSQHNSYRISHEYRAKIVFNKFMQTAVIILFRIMKRKKWFFFKIMIQNKTRGKRFAPDNPYNLYWLL